MERVSGKVSGGVSPEPTCVLLWSEEVTPAVVGICKARHPGDQRYITDGGGNSTEGFTPVNFTQGREIKPGTGGHLNSCKSIRACSDKSNPF